MELKLDNGDLDRAIAAYLVKMGINITNKKVDLKFSVGRAPNNVVTVAVNINEVAPTDLGESVIASEEVMDDLEDHITEEIVKAAIVELSEETQEELPLETEEAVEEPKDVKGIFDEEDAD